MQIDRKIYDLCREQAQNVMLETRSIDPVYTAVAIGNGGIGIANTCLIAKNACSVAPITADFGSRPAGC